MLVIPPADYKRPAIHGKGGSLGMGNRARQRGNVSPAIPRRIVAMDERDVVGSAIMTELAADGIEEPIQNYAAELTSGLR